MVDFVDGVDFVDAVCVGELRLRGWRMVEGGG